jgi:hypothetical protein
LGRLYENIFKTLTNIFIIGGILASFEENMSKIFFPKSSLPSLELHIHNKLHFGLIYFHFIIFSIFHMMLKKAKVREIQANKMFSEQMSLV